MLRRIFPTSLLALGLALLTGCGPSTPLSPDQTLAQKQVLELIPKGTPEVRAKRLLTERGFTLSQLSAAPTTGRMLVASYNDKERSWLIGLVVVDARVVATSVTISEMPRAVK